MTRFRGAKVCRKWLQERIDDHSIQSDCKCTIGLKVQKWQFSNWLCLLGDVARLHDRHQWQHDNQDWLPHRAHQHEHVSAKSFVCQSIVTLHTAPHWLKSELCPSFSPSTWAHDVCGSSSTLISHFSSSFTSRTSCGTSSTSLMFVANLCTPPEKGMDSWRNQFPHMLWAQHLRLHGDLRRVLHRVPDLPAVLQARVSRGRRVRWHRTREFAAWSSPITCPSLSTRRLVCRSVVVCVRNNGATCWTTSRKFSAFSGGLAWTVFVIRRRRISVESLMECFVCVSDRYFHAKEVFQSSRTVRIHSVDENVFDIWSVLPACVLKRSLVVVFLSVQLFFLAVQFSAVQCTCNRPMILTLTDHHCQHWLKKKLPSSPCDIRSCFPSPPSGTLIAAYQAEEQSTG